MLELINKNHKDVCFLKTNKTNKILSGSTKKMETRALKKKKKKQDMPQLKDPNHNIDPKP